MKKIVFAVLLCGLLMISCGTAAVAEEEAWITIKQMPGEGTGAPYHFSGSTVLEEGQVRQVNITSLVNGVSESETVPVTTRDDGPGKKSNYWRLQTRLAEFPPGPCTVTVTGLPERPGISVSAEFSLPEIWIKIDPLPFITADMDNVTFSGTTTIPAGERFLVEVLNADTTTVGPFYGRHGVIHVQNGTGDMQTWSFSINTTVDMPPLEYLIKVTGIENDRMTSERFMLYPAGYTTLGLTTSLSPKGYWIKIDPIPFITADMGNITFTGTTTIPAGREVLANIRYSDAAPDGMPDRAGSIFERIGTTTIQNGTGTIQTWNISINTTGFSSREYVIVVYGVGVDRSVREHFMIYPTGYTTSGPTKASGFLIIPLLFAAAAAVMLTRK